MKPQDEPKGRPTPARILLLAAWFGLVTGFVELACLVARCHWIDPRYYNTSRHFIWMVPASGLMVLGPVGVILAMLTWAWPRQVTWFRAAALLAFLSSLSVLLRWPMYTSACVLLAVGLGVQAGRWISARANRFVPMAGRSLVGMVGLLAVLIAGSYARQAGTARRAISDRPGPDAPNVLLVVLDTVRAESLSLYGYDRPTSPNLARLAARGVCFDQAMATAPWTTPSHASLFTGRWAHDLSAGWKTPLDRTHPTLAEFLTRRGYDTAGFVANTYYCSYETGLDRGFAHYEDYDVSVRQVLLGSALVQRGLTIARARLGLWLDDPRQPNAYRKSAARINGDFLAWLDRRRTTDRGERRPFFAFLNFYDAHHPYLPPESEGPHFGRRPEARSDFLLLRTWWDADKRRLSPDDVALARDAYDDCIASLDRQIGRLVAELERRGVLDDTLVIVTSDHGEHLGERDLFGHGCSLYRPELHVPLIVVPPASMPGAKALAGRVVREPVSLRDVPATVVDLLGLSDQAPFPGRSLAARRDRPGGEVEPLLSEVRTAPEADPNRGRSPAARGPMRSLMLGTMHYIRNGDGREELYDLAADPRETRDLAAEPGGRAMLASLRASMRSLVSGAGRPDLGVARGVSRKATR